MPHRPPSAKALAAPDVRFPEGLAEIVADLLQKNPDQRPSSAQTVQKRLAQMELRLGVRLLNRTTLRAFEADQGSIREEARFRPNILFDNLPAWEEFEWVGRRLRIGTAVLEVTKRTVRCAAVEVNPATGTRDADPIRELKHLYGHADLGIHAAVIEGGRIAPGDTISVL